MKLLLLGCFLFFSVFSLGQEVERISVNGKIKVPTGEEVEEISVYNISSEKGTVTNANGEFTLQIAENDRLQITALQFQSRQLIIRKEDVDNRMLLIYMNPNVYHLGAAIVRSTDLTGIPELDAKTIATSVYAPEWDLSYAALEFGYNFENDGQTDATGNAADEALGVNSVPVASVDLVELVKLFFRKKKQTPKEVFESKRIAAGVMLQRYSIDYLSETFGIPSGRVNDFVLFTEENGLTLSLMNPANEIELLEFLLEKSKEYKQRIAIGG